MSNFGLILSDTSRSRAYLSAISKNKIFPKIVVLLDEDSSINTLPGKLSKNFEQKIIDAQWPEANFNPTASLYDLLEDLNLNFVVAGSRDINDLDVINLLARFNVDMYVYSGYGGAILREKILSIEKLYKELQKHQVSFHLYRYHHPQQIFP